MGFDLYNEHYRYDPAAAEHPEHDLLALWTGTPYPPGYFRLSEHAMRITLRVVAALGLPARFATELVTIGHRMLPEDCRALAEASCDEALAARGLDPFAVVARIVRESPPPPPSLLPPVPDQAGACDHPEIVRRVPVPATLEARVAAYGHKLGAFFAFCVESIDAGGFIIRQTHPDRQVIRRH